MVHMPTAEEFAALRQALADAQKQGYAETPPDLDIDGIDAEHKTGILASLAHGFWVNPKQIHVEGIRNISKLDMQFAQQLGYTIKLLGIVKMLEVVKGKAKGGKQIQVSVYPTLIPNAHVLASVNGVVNAVFVRGDVVGDTQALKPMAIPRPFLTVPVPRSNGLPHSIRTEILSRTFSRAASFITVPVACGRPSRSRFLRRNSIGSMPSSRAIRSV